MDATAPETSKVYLSLEASSSNPLVAVELPVYASNHEKALEMIDGVDNLRAAHSSKSQFLPVKLRPQEPSCKPIFADRTSTQSILIKLKKKPRPSTQEDVDMSNEVGADSSEMSAQVIGVANEKFICDGMADFQYLTSRRFHPSSTAHFPQTPTESDDHSLPHKQVLEMAKEPQPVATGGSYVSSSEIQIAQGLRPYLHVNSVSETEILPGVFSKIDHPIPYEFRPNAYNAKDVTEAPSINKAIQIIRFQDQQAPSELDTDIPSFSREPALQNDALDAKVLDVLRSRLEQQPIWLRDAFFYDLEDLELRAAKRLVRQLCYVITDGPWRHCFIKLGVDPRTDASFYQYQAIEVRHMRALLQPQVQAKDVVPRRKRHRDDSRRKLQRVAQSDAVNADSNAHVLGSNALSNQNSLNNANNNIKRRRPKIERSADAETPDMIFRTPIANANGFFQICFLMEEEVEFKQVLDEFGTRPECTRASGWLSADVVNILRELIRLKIGERVERPEDELRQRRNKIETMKKAHRNQI